MVKAVLIFPGQGAQKVGMGRDLAQRFSVCQDLFDAVDERLGMALTRLMWEGPNEELTLTHNAQPAILTHALAVYTVIRDALEPVAAAGHSLGEYTAYAAAGALSPTDAAALVRTRGELMLAAGRARPGTMTAILGLDTRHVETACSQACAEGGVAVAANINAPDQTVISGDPDTVARAGERCRAAGAKRVVPLNVSGAFHSPLMAPARAGLERELSQVSLSDPDFPVIANARAEAVSDGNRARVLLGEQLTAPVRWVECMGRALELGGEEITFVELGPGRVLSGLLKRIHSNSRALNFETADDVEAFMETVA